MTSRRQFILKLSFLIIPFAILSLILRDEGTSGGVGGGGNDLSGLVYGSALFAVINIKTHFDASNLFPLEFVEVVYLTFPRPQLEPGQ